jgi:hypothetical protein
LAHSPIVSAEEMNCTAARDDTQGSSGAALLVIAPLPLLGVMFVIPKIEDIKIWGVIVVSLLYNCWITSGSLLEHLFEHCYITVESMLVHMLSNR